MRYEEVIQAWKSPAFRATLAGTDASMMLAHPSGFVDLNDSDLDAVSGAGGSSSSCSGGGKKSGKSGKAKSAKKAKSGKSGGGGGWNPCSPCR